MHAIESWGNKVLGVVTEQFHGSKHGNTSVLEFAEDSLFGDLWFQVWLSKFEISEESVVVDGSNEEDHLGPSEGRDGGEGGNTVRDIVESESRGDITRESEELRDNVSNNAKLGNTSVL